MPGEFYKILLEERNQFQDLAQKIQDDEENQIHNLELEVNRKLFCYLVIGIMNSNVPDVYSS